MKRRKPMLFDREATATAGFLDPLSYCKRSKDGEMQTFLFGRDMAELRRRVFERSRGYCEVPIHGIQNGRCQRCITWETMELHHSPTRAQGGDDSEESTMASCKRCHIAVHNRQTRWTKKAVLA
jgi:hypothetical protein